MLTDHELRFIAYWEKVREPKSRFSAKLAGGLPMAMLFGLPILLFMVVVRIFFKDWYAKISHFGIGPFIAAIVAVMIAIVFYAWFRMHFKWEMNEQFYKELKTKQKKQATGV